MKIYKKTTKKTNRFCPLLSLSFWCLRKFPSFFLPTLWMKSQRRGSVRWPIMLQEWRRGREGDRAAGQKTDRPLWYEIMTIPYYKALLILYDEAVLRSTVKPVRQSTSIKIRKMVNKTSCLLNISRALITSEQSQLQRSRESREIRFGHKRRYGVSFYVSFCVAVYYSF